MGRPSLVSHVPSRSRTLRRSSTLPFLDCDLTDSLDSQLSASGLDKMMGSKDNCNGEGEGDLSSEKSTLLMMTWKSNYLNWG